MSMAADEKRAKCIERLEAANRMLGKLVPEVYYAAELTRSTRTKALILAAYHLALVMGTVFDRALSDFRD